MSPLSLKVLEQVDLHAPGGRSVAELINVLGRPREEVESSVSSLKHAGLLQQSRDARWHRLRAEVRPLGADQSDRSFPTVIKRGEKRACVSCQVEKGATAFNVGDVVCRHCRNHGATAPENAPVPPVVTSKSAGAKPTPRDFPFRRLADDAVSVTLTGPRPAWVDAALTDLRARRAALDVKQRELEAEKIELDAVINQFVKLFGDKEIDR